MIFHRLSRFGSKIGLNRIYRKLRNLSSEHISYLVAVFGVVGDQTTTRLSLDRCDIIESTPLTGMLIEHNVWLVVDVFMLGLLIGISSIFVRKVKTHSSRMILAFPLFLGVFRLVAAIWNFHVLLLS